MDILQSIEDLNWREAKGNPVFRVKIMSEKTGKIYTAHLTKHDIEFRQWLEDLILNWKYDEERIEKLLELQRQLDRDNFDDDCRECER